MKKEIIVRLHSQFEDIARTWPEAGTEFWLARDLQDVLGYARWENFRKVIEKAKTSCLTAGYEPDDHFLEVTKMVNLGSGAVRKVDDIALTRHDLSPDRPRRHRFVEKSGFRPCYTNEVKS